MITFWRINWFSTVGVAGSGPSFCICISSLPCWSHLNMDVSALLGKSASPTTKRADIKGKRKASELNGENENGGPTQILRPTTTPAPKKMRVGEQSSRFSCIGKCQKCGVSFDMTSSAQTCQFHPGKARKLYRLSCLADRINR